MSLREASNSNRVTSYTESIPFIVAIHVKIPIPYSYSQAFFLSKKNPALILSRTFTSAKSFANSISPTKIESSNSSKVPVKRLKWWKPACKVFIYKSCDQIFLVLQWQHADLDRHRFVKFIYSEKATKFCEISTLILSSVHTVKSKVEISQTFVAFSEYMKFDFNILKVYETTPTLIQILFHKKRAYHRTL